MLTAYNNPIIIPNLQMKTLRHTKDKSHAQATKLKYQWVGFELISGPLICAVNHLVTISTEDALL